MGDDRAAVTHRRVLNIALPVVLANVTLPILGAVDTAVVGQMGAAAPIGAVGIGAIILGAFYWLFGFLRMGTVGIASQALGAGQHGEVAALLTRVLLLGGGGGVVFVILQQPLFWLAFQLSPASSEVEDLASQYMTIRILSAPAAIAMFGITGWLVAQERTRAVLVIQLWMNGLNVALDLWFVLGLGWGVAASMCLACCLIPSTVYSFVSGIMMIVQGVLLLGNHPQRHLQRTRWTASLQIGCLLAADIPNVILGILNHMFLGDDAVKAYQNQVKPESK